MELSYAQIKSANEARESEEQRIEYRKKSLLLLIHSYLTEEGYLNSASSLIEESGISLRKFTLCDNIDLETILQEYNVYYNIKFGRNPKIVKKVDMPPLNGVKAHRKPSGNLPRISETSHGERNPKVKPEKRKTRSADRKDRPPENKKTDNQQHFEAEAVKLDMGLTGTAVNQNKDERRGGKVRTIIDVRQMLHDSIHNGPDPTLPTGTGNPGVDEKLLKPLAMFANRDMRELAASISRDIYLNNPNVRWGDIFGLEDAKRVLKEAVVYPIKYPQLFTGILSPWKGLLLYGPPGTGKTLLAKAVATECKTTFFNISASSIVSKWRGDSEKLVRVLFELARFHAPSTIFVDEMECLMSQRGGSRAASNEHEGSLRMKTELLVQMDGLSKSDDLVFLLAASNLPWELDHAMLRRLEKRILVDLPSLDARKEMFRYHLPPLINQSGEGIRIEAKVDYHHLGEVTAGYTGSDIHLVCKEAVMSRVRKIFNILEDMENNKGNTNNINYQNKLQIEPVTTEDVKTALSYTKPSAQNLAARYESWRKKYEST